MLQVLKPPCPEPVLRNKTSLHNEKPVHHNWRRPLCGNEDPVQPKLNKSFKKSKGNN